MKAKTYTSLSRLHDNKRRVGADLSAEGLLLCAGGGQGGRDEENKGEELHLDDNDNVVVVVSVDNVSCLKDVGLDVFASSVSQAVGYNERGRQ